MKSQAILHPHVRHHRCGQIAWERPFSFSSCGSRFQQSSALTCESGVAGQVCDI